jgi:uncharacterized protein (TIGR03086 family)
MDDLAALDRATVEFRSRLEPVTPADLTKPTPCSEWNVAALIDHVARGNRMTELLMHGADARTSVGPAAAAPPDAAAIETYDRTAADQRSSFSEAGAMERLADHPAAQMPGSLLLLFRSIDLAIHAMDLADALGLDPGIDDDLAESLWLRTEPLAAILAASGMFGSPPEQIPPDLAPLQKLLLATGR